jgi:hypothetical protein
VALACRGMSDCSRQLILVPVLWGKHHIVAERYTILMRYSARPVCCGA